MKIIVNGESRDVEDGTTISRLLESLGFKPEVTVVERNEDIVDRQVFGTTLLEDGDKLELVRFVGGG